MDVLVLMQEPVVPFSFLRAKPIGVMRMMDQGEQDDKIIAVHAGGHSAPLQPCLRSAVRPCALFPNLKCEDPFCHSTCMPLHLPRTHDASLYLADDPEFKEYTDISELPVHRLAEIRRFFEDYKKNENKVRQM